MVKKSKFAIAQLSHKSCYKLLQELPQDLKHKLTDTDGKSFIKWTIGGRWGFSYSVKAQLLPLNPDTTKVIIEASSDGIVDGLGVLSRSVQRLLKDFNTKVAKEIAHKESEQLFADVTPQKVMQFSETVPLKQSPFSILFLAADPTDTSRLRLGEELREIQDRLQSAKLRETFELHQRMSVRPTDVSQALLDIYPKIVHFSGHGTSAGELCFENKTGELHPVSPDALAALFEQFAGQIKCVVLNACYSKVQAHAIAKYIDYVIGMDQAVGDQAAIAFSVGFYQSLGAGRSIEESYKLGCIQIRLHNIPEYLTPLLIKRG